MKYLITGSAGFIGYHLSKRLLNDNNVIVGVDNLCDYYPVSLKNDRNDILLQNENYSFHRCDISDYNCLKKIFSDNNFDAVINLAAQAGVRYSIDNPFAYVNSNLIGFMNILECCRNNSIAHLIYASSSSVYGMNRKTPFSEKDFVDHPISLYAATKKSNELLAHSYSHLYKIPSTGLRFFTVYGPYGRPDMAYYKFANAIIRNEPIDVYNFGDLKRDFTFVDDIVEGIVRLIDKIPAEKDTSDITGNETSAPYRIFNIGNNNPVSLLEFINTLEELLGRKAVKNMLPMQKGDVYETFADIDELNSVCGYKPSTSLREGLERFVEWYKKYYNLV